MKRTFIAVAIALASIAAQAQDMGVTLASQVRVSPTKTVDISHARYISLTPGNQYVIDRNGVKHPAAFASITTITLAAAFQNYNRVAGDLYQNLSESTAVECANGATLITWLSGAQETRTDGCAFNDSTMARSRAR